MFSAILGFIPKLVSTFLFRKLNYEHAREGLAALRVAEGIFKASRDLGGMYSYPWYLGKEIVDSSKLFEDLDALGNRARSKKLHFILNNIKKSLDIIYVNATVNPLIIVDGVSDLTDEQNELNLVRAKSQQSANDVGIPLIIDARELIAKLETRPNFS